ncbi:hypothetical protein ZYGR_0AZ01930 [Zygosaccharomyces rouxii]|uniref:C2H2-type domain-containing protein n=1 Tax=Zygosaccharomyces rouxii TaxID=4956 RepID=A0A1Q3AJY6_ZYGRO|nr:hypothetical protein ZYGR_0AZ01930 [Zygosaccharomyces rouxii]
MSNPLEELVDGENQEGLIGSSGDGSHSERGEPHTTMSYLNARPFIKPEALEFSSPDLKERNENSFVQNYALQQNNNEAPNDSKYNNNSNNNNNVNYGKNGDPLPSLNTSDVFFSPSSTSSQNWRTPTLKVEDHDGWQEMLEPSPMSHQDVQSSQPFENDARFLNTSSWQPETDPYASDLDSDFGGTASVYHTPNLTAQDATLASPAMSYLTTGDDEVDDLLSVKSGMSGSSNCMLPIDPDGYKHVTNINELDNLLTVINDHFDLEFNDLGSSSVPNNNLALRRDMNLGTPEQQQPQSTQPPPVISIQEFPEQPVLNKEEDQHLKEQDSSPSPEETVPLQRQRDRQHDAYLGLQQEQDQQQQQQQPQQQQQQQQSQNILLCPTDSLSDASYEEMRSGRIKKRRASQNSRRLSRTSRSSSISPDEKARSLGEDSDRLLELADLQLPSPIPSRQNSNKKGGDNSNNISGNEYITAGGNSMGALEEGETLQKLSGNTKKRLSQKNPATFACELCGKRFTRPYNLKSHLRTHTNERPFECSICGKAFARQHDRKRHEDLHTGKKRYVCGGTLKNGASWGCGKKFARSDALGRHFKTESGRRCIVPLYEEASREKGFIPDLPG